ncbi:MAG TPA: F0F1 ATP synthase subunit A, partial [Limnochordales bacterium]
MEFLLARLEAIGEVVQELAPRPVIHVGPYVLTSTVVNSWVVVAAIVVLAYVVGRRIQERPRGLQTLAEVYYQFIEGLLHSALGHADRRFVPLVGTYFLLVLGLNYAW